VARGGIRRVLPGPGLDGRAGIGIASVVCDGDTPVCWRLHSVSKSSSLAGYGRLRRRGRHRLVGALLAVRKQAGMDGDGPVQSAMSPPWRRPPRARAADRYRDAGNALLRHFRSAGFTVDHSHAGLYLWVTARGMPRYRQLGWRKAHSCGAHASSTVRGGPGMSGWR